MSKLNNILTKFKNMPVDGMTKTLFVAITLCLVCSMVVSFAAVNLKEVQEVNKAIDKQKNILQVAGLYYEGIDVEKSFSSFEPIVVDLNQGKFTNRFDPLTFDDKKAAQDPKLSISLKEDPASIGRRTNFATVYLLKKEENSLLFQIPNKMNLGGLLKELDMDRAVIEDIFIKEGSLEEAFLDVVSTSAKGGL